MIYWGVLQLHVILLWKHLQWTYLPGTLGPIRVELNLGAVVCTEGTIGVPLEIGFKINSIHMTSLFYRLTYVLTDIG